MLKLDVCLFYMFLLSIVSLYFHFSYTFSVTLLHKSYDIFLYFVTLILIQMYFCVHYFLYVLLSQYLHIKTKPYIEVCILQEISSVENQKGAIAIAIVQR